MGNSLSSRTTGDDIMKGKSLDGLTAVITGPDSGIGREMAYLLAKAGARVVMAVRKIEAGEYAAQLLRERIKGTAAAGDLIVMECNLASFASIRAFAAQLQQRVEHIDLLVLNAAIRGCPKWYTQEGFEMQMGVNYIGHWHLTQLLLPYMKQQPARVIMHTCIKELDTSFRLNDLNFGKHSYDPFRSYKASKIALTLFSRQLARELEGTQISVFAADPGVTGETALFRFMGPLMIMFAFAKPFLKTLQQATATPMYACVTPVSSLGSRRRTSFGRTVGIRSGALLANCQTVAGNRLINSHYVAQNLWKDTEKMVNEAVIGSHAANAGYQSDKSAQLLMQWLLKPLFDIIRRAFRSAATGHAAD